MTQDKELTVYVDAETQLVAAERESAELLLRRLRTTDRIGQGVQSIRRHITELVAAANAGYFRDPQAYLRNLPLPAEHGEETPVAPAVRILEAIRDGVRFDPHAQDNPARHIPEGAQVISYLSDPANFHLVHINGAYAGLVTGQAIAPEQARDLFAAFYTPASQVYEMAKDRTGLFDDRRGRSGLRARRSGDPKSAVSRRGRIR